MRVLRILRSVTHGDAAGQHRVYAQPRHTFLTIANPRRRLRAVRNLRNVLRMTEAITTIPDGAIYLTPREVADLLRISVRKVYVLAHAGDIEGVKFGGSLRITAKSVDAYRAASHAAGL